MTLHIMKVSARRGTHNEATKMNKEQAVEEINDRLSDWTDIELLSVNHTAKLTLFEIRFIGNRYHNFISGRFIEDMQEFATLNSVNYKRHKGVVALFIMRTSEEVEE